MTRADERARRRPRICGFCERGLVEHGRCVCADWLADDLLHSGGPGPAEEHKAWTLATAAREVADAAALVAAQAGPRGRPAWARPLPRTGTGPGGEVTVADLLRRANRPECWAGLGL